MYSYSQVPFGDAVEKTCEQLKVIARGDYELPATGRIIGPIVYVGVSLPVSEINDLLYNVSDYQNKKFLVVSGGYDPHLETRFDGRCRWC